MIKRCLAEFVGTFGIVFAPVALSGTGRLAGSDNGLMAAAWVSGLAVTAMIYALGHISGAHFNPAVTLGFASVKRFPWKGVAPYCLSQLAGGIFAAWVCAQLLGAGRGVHLPAVDVGRAICTEAVLTFFLMLVIMGVASDKRANGAVPGIAIGLMVVVDVLIGGPVTGGSMNPARSLGPALFSKSEALANWWIYLVGPILGAITAAVLYEAMRSGEQFGKSVPEIEEVQLL